MPIMWLENYWKKMGAIVLPFLRDRRVAIEEKFDGEIIYRRHPKEGKSWIRIRNEKDILEWAHTHTFSFHPHLAGEKDTWFIMDIDMRDRQMDFSCCRIATYKMCELLDKFGLKYIVKFSGGRGFHFLASFGKVGATQKVWESERKIIRFFQEQLEKTLQKSNERTKFYKFIPKSHPITICNSQDNKHKHSILIDELIVHKNGMIRSPYSIHPGTELVSVPLQPSEIMKFIESDAKPDKIHAKKLELPQNSLEKLLNIIK